MRYEVCFSCYKKEKGIDEWDSNNWDEEEENWEVYDEDSDLDE